MNPSGMAIHQAAVADGPQAQSLATIGLMRALTCALFLLTGAVASAQQVELILSVPNQANGSPTISATEYLEENWTQTVSLTNVTISAFVQSSNAGDTSATAYLTTQIGPGATSATLIAQANLKLPAGGLSSPELVLFTGLNLGPGTYYLVLATSDTSTNEGWNNGTYPSVATTPGITFNGPGFLAHDGAAYPPAGNFSFTYSSGFAFDVAEVSGPTQMGVNITTFPLPNAYPTDNPSPLGITVGPDGALWFADEQNGIGRITTGFGSVETKLLPGGRGPTGIATGPDGALWFAETNEGSHIGRMTTKGILTEYATPTPSSGPTGITSGPDGALWFTEAGANKIGRSTTAGVIIEYTLPTPNTGIVGITVGPDGALWFTEPNVSQIGRITTAGTINEYPLPNANSPQGITAGPDGALWFVEWGNNSIGRITTSGAITEYPVPTGGPTTELTQGPYGITAGPDGALWFTDASQVCRITTAGVFTAYVIAPLEGNNSPAGLAGITTGPDGALWFSEYSNQAIGRLMPAPTAAFFTGEVWLGSGVYYLQFPDGNLFGYYNLTTFPSFYHYDLGFESFIDGGNGSAFLYDFASNHWFYTSPSLFPYLYDFTLKNWLYYFLDLTRPGHYTTNPRHFINLGTNQFFTM